MFPRHHRTENATTQCGTTMSSCEACHPRVEVSCGIRLSETVAARDGGAKPTGTYLRRVSDRRMPQLAVRGKTRKETKNRGWKPLLRARQKNFYVANLLTVFIPES